MKKIRILTFWDVPNYGGFLQAYSLQKIIETRYNDCDVKQIPYLNKIHYSMYYSLLKRNYRFRYINPKYYLELLSLKERFEQIKITREFIKYYNKIPHNNRELKNGIRNLSCDLLILGSDIIWDYSIDFIKDKYLFGEGIDAKRKISYAPSFGTVSSGKKAPDYVKNALNALDAISVRDEKSRRLVQEISGRDATVVLDPTLIWNFENDEKIIAPKIESYMVVYGSYFSDELIKGAQEYCKENGLKLICLSSLDEKFSWCDMVISQDSLNPFEWAGYFKSASIIMTCTYHGLMFGLIFKKKIIFHPTEFIMNKASSLINDLGLMDVLVNYTSFDSKINWNWDYAYLSKLLEKNKDISFRYLDGEIKI